MLNSHCQELIQLVYQCSSTYTVVQQKNYCTEVSRSKFALVLVPPSPPLSPLLLLPQLLLLVFYYSFPSFPLVVYFTKQALLLYSKCFYFASRVHFRSSLFSFFFCCCMSSFILVWGTTMFPLLFDLKLKGNFCCLHVRR